MKMTILICLVLALSLETGLAQLTKGGNYNTLIRYTYDGNPEIAEVSVSLDQNKMKMVSMRNDRISNHQVIIVDFNEGYSYNYWNATDVCHSFRTDKMNLEEVLNEKLANGIRLIGNYANDVAIYEIDEKDTRKSYVTGRWSKGDGIEKFAPQTFLNLSFFGLIPYFDGDFLDGINFRKKSGEGDFHINACDNPRAQEIGAETMNSSIFEKAMNILKQTSS